MHYPYQIITLLNAKKFDKALDAIRGLEQSCPKITRSRIT